MGSSPGSYLGLSHDAWADHKVEQQETIFAPLWRTCTQANNHEQTAPVFDAQTLYSLKCEWKFVLFSPHSSLSYYIYVRGLKFLLGNNVIYKHVYIFKSVSLVALFSSDFNSLSETVTKWPTGSCRTENHLIYHEKLTTSSLSIQYTHFNQNNKGHIHALVWQTASMFCMCYMGLCIFNIALATSRFAYNLLLVRSLKPQRNSIHKFSGHKGKLHCLGNLLGNPML